MSRLLLHAPGVHAGGGLTLLRELLAARNLGELWANLDVRARAALSPLRHGEYHFIEPTPVSRLKAEFRLKRAAHRGDLVLCFHGMPPVLPVEGRVVVFAQNRIHLGSKPPAGFSGWLKTRITLERVICRRFRHHVHEYVVQTPSMRSAVVAWHGANPKVRIVPFAGRGVSGSDRPERVGRLDFIYVADGEPHKNHRSLLAAWILLAGEGVCPSLGITISPRYAEVSRELEQAAGIHDLQVTNFGLQSHESILELYQSSKALIFPSVAESFGLPLIEATQAGLPILASELDFVRDVCTPVETFDPHSAVSIARAVKRFLKIPTEIVRLRTAEDLIAELGCDSSPSAP